MIIAYYTLDTGQLNRQVKRNIERFHSDFMFQLTKKELEILKCQNGIASWGGDKKLQKICRVAHFLAQWCNSFASY